MLASTEDVQRIQARVLHTIRNGLEFDLTTYQCKQFLKRHVNSNTSMVVLFVDINGSTQMSINLPPPKFAMIVQVFTRSKTGNHWEWRVRTEVCWRFRNWHISCGI
jgi:hypothetical protein